jgi:hypothetical protein
VFYTSVSPVRAREGGDVVFDYRDSRRAWAAHQILGAAGIPAVYTPDKLVEVSDDPGATLWLVHRVTVPAADAVRAAASLDEHSLVPTTGR